MRAVSNTGESPRLRHSSIAGALGSGGSTQTLSQPDRRTRASKMFAAMAGVSEKSGPIL